MEAELLDHFLKTAHAAASSEGERGRLGTGQCQLCHGRERSTMVGSARDRRKQDKSEFSG